MVSKKKHKNREREMREENNFNNNSYNNQNPYGGFDNSPLAQISRMIGNIDMNALAQLLANFNIQENDYKGDKVNNYESEKKKSKMTEKNRGEQKNISKEENTVDENEDVNEQYNKINNTESINNVEIVDEPVIIDNIKAINIDNEVDNDKREEIIKLLMCLRNLCDDKIKEEINRLIQIYSCN